MLLTFGIPEPLPAQEECMGDVDLDYVLVVAYLLSLEVAVHVMSMYGSM